VGELKYNPEAKTFLEACGIDKEAHVDFQAALYLAGKSEPITSNIDFVKYIEKLVVQGDPITIRIICTYAVKGINVTTNKMVRIMELLKSMGLSETFLEKAQTNPALFDKLDGLLHE
jgi:hypothetical protein